MENFLGRFKEKSHTPIQDPRPWASQGDHRWLCLAPTTRMPLKTRRTPF